MAIEYRLSHTASEIDRKLTTVDEIESSLKNNYYTSTDIDTKIEEVNTSIGEVNTTLEEINTSLEEVNTSLTTKADLVDGKIPASQIPDDIGGGLTEVSWEDIKDKPFEEIINNITILESQPMTTTDLTESFGMPFYGFTGSLENTTMTEENFYNNIQASYDETIYNLTKAHSADVGVYYFGNGSLLNVLGGNIEDTGEPFVIGLMANEGTVNAYLFITNDTQEVIHTVAILAVGNETIKTLDIKYLPSNMALGYEVKGEGVIWDGNTNGLTEVATEFEEDGTLMRLAFYKVSDEIPLISEMVGKQWSLSGVDGESSETITEGSCLVFADDGSYMVGGDVLIIVCLSNDTTLPLVEMMGAAEDITFPEAGIWFAKASVGGAVMMQATSLTSPDTLVPIDEKFIPDTIARQSDLDNIDLSNYYTKNETYDSWTIDNKIANVSVDLSGYYTKDEIDEMLGDIDTVINEINTLIGE